MLPPNMYVRQMLVQDRRRALSRESRVPAWERRAAVSGGIPEPRSGGRLRMLVLRLRPVHSGS